MAVSYADERMAPVDRIDLWEDRIPRGDVTLLFGDGAVGKGRMISDLIGRVTTGRPMPLCPPESAGPPGSVIVVLPEDDPNEQVAHRLRAARADLSRVYDLTRLDGGSRFKLSADAKNTGHLPHLRGLVDRLEEEGRAPRLVVIDPLAAVLGWGTISTNAGARRLVEPLQDMAKDTGVAVLVVAHTVKSGALQGSAGLPQALRTVWKVSRDPDNPAYRVLTLEKHNNLPDAEPLRYTIAEDADGAVRVEWLDLDAVQEQRMGWRQKVASLSARRAAPAPVTPEQAKKAGCRHSTTKFGTARECGDCPARRLRSAPPAAPRTPAAPIPVTWTATQYAAQGPVILASGVRDEKMAQRICEQTPAARALAGIGQPLQWAPQGAHAWTAGDRATSWAVTAEVAQARGRAV